MFNFTLKDLTGGLTIMALATIGSYSMFIGAVHQVDIEAAQSAAYVAQHNLCETDSECEGI